MAERLYLEGLPADRLRQRLREEYGVSLKTARRYLKRVMARFATLPAPSPEAVRARAEAMLLTTFELAKGTKKYVTVRDGVTPAVSVKTKLVRAPDLAVMATCAGRLAELHGAVAPKQVQLGGPGGGPVPVSVVGVYLPPEDNGGAAPASPAAAAPAAAPAPDAPPPPDEPA